MISPSKENSWHREHRWTAGGGFRRVLPFCCTLLFLCSTALPAAGRLAGGEGGMAPDRSCPSSKDVLTTERVRSLLGSMDALAASRRRAWCRRLAEGGPWVPVLLETIEEGKAGATWARAILRILLERRPTWDDPPPPGESLLAPVDPFGNAHRGRGTAFRFPGRWPGPVPLERFLERVNETARPTLPLLLDPLLGDDPALILSRKPLEGPASLVVGRVLRRLHLGVTYLETVALVHAGGGPPSGRTRAETKEDRILLDRCLDALADPHAGLGTRRAAYHALAWLGLPGLFQGSLRAFDEGRYDPALDLLLTGRCRRAFAASLGEDAKEKGRLRLQRLWELWRTGGDEGEADAPRRQALESFLLDLFLAPQALTAEAGTADLAGTSLEQALLLQGCALLRDPGRVGEFMDTLGGEGYRDRRRARFAGKVLRRVAAGSLDDRVAARLVGDPLLGPEILDLLPRCGGTATFHALLEGLRSGKITGLPYVEGAVFLAGRVLEKDATQALGRVLLAEGERGAPAGVLGLAAALSRKDPARMAACARLLGDRVLRGGGAAEEAAAMFSFFGGETLPDVLPQVRSLGPQVAMPVRDALQRAVLRAVGVDTLLAERVRRMLLPSGPSGSDPWIDLEEDLSILAGLASPADRTVAVDI